MAHANARTTVYARKLIVARVLAGHRPGVRERGRPPEVGHLPLQGVTPEKNTGGREDPLPASDVSARHTPGGGDLFPVFHGNPGL